MANLEGEVVHRIRALCDHAETFVTIGEYPFAISKFFEALSLIPDPKFEYKAATWIYTSIGEVYWKMKDYNNAGVSYLKAFKSVGGESSGIVNLRLGQCLCECGETTMAAEYLSHAYMLDGETAFDGYDPKYYELIRKEIEGEPQPFIEEDDDDPVTDDDYYMVDDIIGRRGNDSVGSADDEDIDPYELYDRRYYGDGEDEDYQPPKKQRYIPGARQTVHKDDDEDDFSDENGYFDGEGDDYDDDSDEEYSTFGDKVKHAIDWVLNLFK